MSDLRLKCTKFDFRWGSIPDPAGGTYSAPQTPGERCKRAGAPTSKGKAGKDGREGKRKEGEGKRRGSEGGKEGKGRNQARNSLV